MAFVLAYDSDCGPCTRFRNVVEFIDTVRRLRYVSLVQADREGMLESIPTRPRFASFHLIASDGTVMSGRRAIPQLISFLPGGRLPRQVMRPSPIAAKSAAFIYSVLSRLQGVGSCVTQNSGMADVEPYSLNVTINVDINID
jgi:predicted DCC family thiol-disulfide oxidoreductase YuxK